MKKIIFCLLILIFVSTIAYAQGEIPGRPGTYPMRSAIIATIYGGLCYAVYEYGLSDCDSIGGVAGECSTKVVISKNRVNATCQFTDKSLVYEANAEVGVISNCYLLTATSEYFRGTGYIIAAANHGDEPGGNVTMMCTFDLFHN